MMLDGDALDVGRLVVEEGRLDLAAGVAVHAYESPAAGREFPGSASTSSINWARARATRERIVPTGQPQARAASS